MKVPVLYQIPRTKELEHHLEVVRADLQLEEAAQAQGSYFVFDETGLSFFDEELGKLHLDFLNSIDYARKAHRGKSELISKAVGLQKGTRKIFDATLGLAQDAWFLARLGAEVQGCERSPVVYLLLADALVRSGESKLQFHYGNSIDWIQRDDFESSVIYIDPMFPEKKKSALPRKEMRIFRKWVGEDADALTLLHTALESSVERVVVKRPLKSEDLGFAPIHSFEGKTVRYDLYTPAGAKGQAWTS